MKVSWPIMPWISLGILQTALSENSLVGGNHNCELS